MKSAYLFHDAFSDPVSDWYQWMKTSLEGMGYFVVVPSFPTPAGQSLSSWQAVVKDAMKKWDEGTIVIGHGAGGAFAMRMVQDAEQPIHGLFLVASYGGKINHAGFDRVNETFFAQPFDFAKIKNNAMVIESFSGQGDPFVPLSASEELANNLGVSNQVIPDGGHVTRADGFTQCVAVLQGIRESMGTLDKSIDPIQDNPEIASIQTPPSFAKANATSPYNSAPTEQARTMYADMSTLVNSNRGSVASSLLSKARQDEAEKKDISPKSTKNIFFILGTVIAIGIALGIAAYILYKNSPANAMPANTPMTSLIMADSHVKIDIAEKTSYAVASAIRATLGKPVDDGMIRDIVYADGTSRASLATVIGILGISAPASFSDQLNDATWMHGEASFAGMTSHFIVIPISHYDSAFSGLRDWEPTMVRDLGIFFGLPDAFIKTTSTTSIFQDAMVQNHPVRALYYHAPVPITLDEPVAQTATPAAQPFTPIPYKQYLKNLKAGSAATATPAVQTPDINFIAPATTPDLPNALLNVPAPYKDGDLMLAYFFLNEHTLVITDSTAIIPQILERYANSQIYK